MNTSPMHQGLNWLPVAFGVHLKVLVLTYKSHSEPYVHKGLTSVLCPITIPGATPEVPLTSIINVLGPLGKNMWKVILHSCFSAPELPPS